MSPKKIILLADNLGNGGAERQLMLLAMYIPVTWDVLLWSIEGGSFLEELRNTSIRFRVAPRKFRFDISPFFDLIRVVKKYQPDVIHSWGWMSTLAGIIVSKIFRIPLINGIIRSAKPYYYRGTISKLLSRFGDVVVSNSRVGLLNWGIEPSRGVVIHNGFDSSRLTIINNSATEKDVQDAVVRVVMAARMVRAKDFDLFIAAARQLQNEGNTKWKFLAVGHGEDKLKLMRENADLIEKGVLEFPEAGTEVLPILCKSNIGVLLTKTKVHEEGCSNTIMEYMACALPVIATDNGGNKELIDDKTGFLIPDGNLGEFVAKLVWLSEHPTRANEMGKKGKEKLQHQFSTEQMVNRTTALYSQTINKTTI